MVYGSISERVLYDHDMSSYYTKYTISGVKMNLYLFPYKFFSGMSEVECVTLSSGGVGDALNWPTFILTSCFISSFVTLTFSSSYAIQKTFYPPIQRSMFVSQNESLVKDPLRFHIVYFLLFVIYLELLNSEVFFSGNTVHSLIYLLKIKSTAINHPFKYLLHWMLSLLC